MNHSFKHSINAGDLLSALPAMKSYYEKTGQKVTVLQALDLPAEYYQGATHGTVDDKGTMVCMNQHIFNMIKPLVESQEYIEQMEVFSGQPVKVDLDIIRKQVFVNLPNGMIQSWVMFAFPNLEYDLSKTWIELPDLEVPEVEGKVIVNFTERYRNPLIHYFFLKEYQDKLIFAGTEKECKLFNEKWQLDIPYLNVDNFLSLAYAIKKCKFLLSNQSMCWNLSTAMGTPRILELCEFAPNCMPFIGEKSYGFYHQVGLNYYFEKLMA